MAILSQPTLDFTNKDFQSLKLRMRGLIKSVFPDWTDFNTPNFGNILVELMAYVGDNLMFYVDAQAREMFWPTMTRRLSAIRQGRLINFDLTGASQAKGQVRITIPAPLSVGVVIPSGTRLRSSNPINPQQFRTINDEDVLLPIGQTFVDVDAEQAELVTGETFESTKAPNQEFPLARIPYLDNSLTVTASDGTYTQVDTFVQEGSDSRSFVVVVDQNDRARLRFGNSIFGKIPEGSIAVSYKLTNGDEGNVDAGQVTILLDTLLDTTSATVNGIVVTNPKKFSGGAPRMSLAQARALAPASLRALTRSVSKDDFETHALAINGVARVLMLTSNEDVSVQENNGLLLVVALGSKLNSGNFNGAIPSPAMLSDIKNEIVTNKPPTITFQLDVQSAPFKTIDVTARVFLEQGAILADTKTAIIEALQDFFSVSNPDGSPNLAIDFGANIKNSLGIPIAEIAWSDVMNAVRDVEGVRKVDEGASGFLLNNLRQSITIGLREFPILGNVVLINADTGLTL